MSSKMYKRVLSILLSVMIVLGLSVTAVSAESEQPSYAGKTVIIYTGNLRGDVDMYAKVATAKKDFQSKGADVYLVDAGNYLQGTTYANSTRGKAIYDLMDAAGYDVAAMGAFEFAYEEASTGQKYHGNFTKYHTQKMLYEGQEKMEYNKNMPGTSKGTLEAVTAPGFKVISSNITGASSASVDNAAAIGNPEKLYSFEPNAVLHEGTLNVGFEALTDSVVPDMLQDNYFNGLSFADTPAAPEGADVDVIVGLSNNGSEVTDAAVTIQAPTDGEEVIGAYAIDNETKAVEEVTLGDYSDDITVADLVSSVKSEAKPVIATSDFNLVGKNSLHRKQETEMGDLVADALLWYAENEFEGFKKDAPVVAIQNGGNVRESLYSGDIIDLDLFHSYPYSPAGVGILYVTGEQLLESLEESTQLPAAFPHVAGMKYNVDLDEEYDASTTKGASGDGKYGNYELADSYNRISITSIDGKKFDPKATYAVIADNMVVANGLDTYGTFKDIKGKATEGEGYINNGDGIPVRDVVGMYLREKCNGTVPTTYKQPQGRITFGPSAYKKAKEAADMALAEAKKATAGTAGAVTKANKAKAAAEALKKEAEITGNEDKIKEAGTAVTDAENAVKKANDSKKAADKAAAAEAKAKKVKTVTVNVATVNTAAINKAVKAKGGSEKYVTKIILGKKVKKISKNAFKKYTKVTTLEVKTKKLKKATVKESLTGSKVKTIKVNVGKKKVNKTYVKKYKKIFTKKNAGKKVIVK